MARRGLPPVRPGPLPLDSEALLDKLPAALARLVPGSSRACWRCATRAAAPGRVLRGPDGCGRLVFGREAALRCGLAGTCCAATATCAAGAARGDEAGCCACFSGLARWPMQYLMRHPGVIDELSPTSACCMATSSPNTCRHKPPRRLDAQRQRPTRKGPARHPAHAPCRGLSHPGARPRAGSNQRDRWPTTCRLLADATLATAWSGLRIK